MRHLVSGAAGFIGSHLCDRLLADGGEVVGLDNLITGSRRNIEHLATKAMFRFHEFDVTEPFTAEGKFDHVWHLASLASPKFYLAHPIETLESGSTGTRNMLEIARRDGARFLVTSTSECYGDPLEHPQVETYWGNVNPVGLRSCYDESKRYAEALTMAYHRTHGVRTNIARIFNTYGPRMALDDGRVVPAFLDQALRGEPLTVFGDGSQTRSFCYVSRYGGGAGPAGEFRGAFSGEPRQSGGTDHPGIRRAHPAADGDQSADRPSASAFRRSQAPAAEYREGEKSARVGAEGETLEDGTCGKRVEYFIESRLATA